MSFTVQTIINDLKEANTLQLLSTAFMEISALKMKSSKDALAQNRKFYLDIQKLYQEIRIDAQEQKLLTNVLPNSRLSIAITSNKRFYGTQNRDLVEKFLTDISKQKTDAIIIGLTGQAYLATNPNAKKIEVIIFKDDYPSAREIYSLLERIQKYERVTLFHPRFINLMVQEPYATDITFKPTALGPEDNKKTYLYEPELKEITNFFETHVRFLLFRRSLLEIELARSSTRLVTMISAEQRATKMIGQKKRELAKAQKSLINARLIETISGAKRWSKI